MSQTVINAHIVGQSIQMANLPLIASGIKGALVIHCDFSEEWGGYGKTAVFYRDAAEVYHIPLVGSEAEVPHEVLAEEGFFFFGIMGAADNVRTTEVLRVSVAKGAITTATAEPAEPTLDIYQQLVAAYDKTERDLAVATARFNEAIKMQNGSEVYDDWVGDEYIGGGISINGASAYVDLTIAGMSLAAGGHHYTDYCLLPGYAPLCPVYLETTNTDINVTIEKADSEHEGWSRILIENVGNTMLTTDMEVSCRGFYPLKYMHYPEVGDIRVALDGEVYPTAGEAVRAQVEQLSKGSTARLSEVSLLASKWVGADSLYSQVVTIPGITELSKVDLLPSVEQLAIFFNKNVSFVTENEDGVVTVYAIGDKPTQNYTMQVQITEVAV